MRRAGRTARRCATASPTARSRISPRTSSRSSRWRRPAPGRLLRAANLRGRAPDGLLIIEDLGTEPVVTGDPPAPIEERYEAAVEVLIALHAAPLPTCPVAPKCRTTPAALRPRRLADRGRAAARLVPAAARRRAGEPHGLRRRCGARRSSRRSRRRRPGCCATSIRPT